MSNAIRVVSRAEIAQERWDAFVDARDECWLWHRCDLIQALATWPGHSDASVAALDPQGALLAILPLHRIEVRVGGALRIVRFNSSGGPACAPQLSNGDRNRSLAALHEHLLQLMSARNVIATQAQIAPLAPWLSAPGAPRVNPLILRGFANNQTETWIVDLTASPEEIRRRYTKSTRYELGKAMRGEFEVREAAGPKDLETYYRLHLETYTRTGARPHPIEYFKAIFERFQPAGLARILFATRRGEAVAGQNTFCYKRGALYWTGASTSQKEGGENRLLLDAQMMAARAAGCLRYETGQAFVSSGDAKERGLSHFKRSFGAEIHPFYRGVLHSQHTSLRFLWGVRNLMQTMRSGNPGARSAESKPAKSGETA